MLSLFSMLSAESSSSSSAMPPIVGIAVLIAIAVLVIAFVVGWKKGIRRISWNGLTWLLAFGIYFVVNGMETGLATPIVAIIGIAVALVLHNVLLVIFRPKTKWKTMKSFKRFGEKARDYEYEMDYSEYDDFLDSRYVMTSKGVKPGFLGRLFGAIFAVVNIVLYIAAIAIFVVYILSTTTLTGAEGLFGEDQQKLELLTYAMDFVVIGLIICLACTGFRKGMIGAFRSFLVIFGSVIAIALAFGLPFLLPEVFASFADMLNPMFVGFGEMGAMLTNVALGLILLIPMLIVIALLNYLIGKLARGIRSVGALRFVDGLFGTVLYAALAIVGCILIVLALKIIVMSMGIGFINTSTIRAVAPDTIVVWATGFARELSVIIKDLLANLTATK